jgi:hypothetical protein
MDIGLQAMHLEIASPDCRFKHRVSWNNSAFVGCATPTRHDVLERWRRNLF